MKMNKMSIIIIAIIFLNICSSSSSSSSDPQQTFIIHVSKSQRPTVLKSHHDWYSSTLGSFPGSKLLYSYELSIHGFAARLTATQASKLGKLPHVLSVVPDQIRQVHTTRTPQFLGLGDSFGLWPNSDYADDVIVGVLDTGIWPERASFNDSGLSPVPEKWKGACETGPEFPACNRKIIGARAFYKGYESGHSVDWSKESKSPRDTEGHGTHTSSTAAGSYVSNAGFYEYAVGEARGMATKARIAMYKICWSPGCYDSDILAAMEQAVADGVDVISLSVGSSYNAPYDHDSIAVGAFGAVDNGVVVSCSAGNSGPGPYTATNIAPWILTVGASSLDREFPADAILGDGRVFPGVSLYSGHPLDSSHSIPLVYAADCGSRYCYSNRLNASQVSGKIVICDRGGNARVAKGDAVRTAGGVGMILANTEDAGEELIADSHLIPATSVGQIAGDKIREYARSQTSPTANIEFRGTVIGPSPPAPKVASFSSRGPNSLTAEILKPDVIAPGLNILAAWTGSVGPTDLDIDPRRVDFNIISGTSMSCPHVSGLAALLKKAFPKWTPGAIKSALMTTAYNLDNSGKKIKDLATGEESTPFIHGAGHVDPNRALNPGLVYDLGTDDYIAFFCSIGYDAKRISVFIKDRSSIDCNSKTLATPGDLNYPSFSVLFKSNNGEVSYKRVVKHVGSEVDAVYEAKVVAPPSVEITVSPSKLVFSQNLQSLSYEITFKSVLGEGKELDSVADAFGSVEWSNGVHLARSPIAVCANAFLFTPHYPFYRGSICPMKIGIDDSSLLLFLRDVLFKE